MKTLKPGPVMLDIAGLELTQEDRELLQHPLVGGVILFARNYESPPQVQALCQQIKTLRDPHLLIAVDQEGGRVQRFQTGFTRLPPLANIKEAHIAQELGWLMATEVLNVGVDISFAPVIDLDLGISQVIGNRSFSPDPQVIAELAGAYIEGMRQAGMGATGKHFPGHGSVAADSHIAIPEDPRELATIRALDLIPFKALATQLRGIMPAHVIYSAVDALPAGFSKFWLQTILREELKFEGLIFSDDLSMEGATQVGDHTDRAKIALSAGCDMVLVCNDREHAIKVVEGLSAYQIPSNLQHRIAALYGKKAQKLDTVRYQAALSLVNHVA